MKKEPDPSRGLTLAAIDIGTNAVRLLIKHKDNKPGSKFTKLMMLRYPLRLGFDVFSTGKISENKEKKLIRLMKACKLLIKIHEVDACRACATSAMRDAANGKRIMEKIEEKAGIRIEIIGGEEEARIIYNNHLESTQDKRGNYLYVDVGGGSTETNLIAEGKLLFSKSYNIGTVRMLNKAVEEGSWSELDKDLSCLAEAHPGIEIIGSGGNINKLYRLARRKEARKTRMPVEELERLYRELAPLGLPERMEKFELKPDRADVIVPAAEIFLHIAALIHARFIYVPVIGLADGIIDDLYLRYMAGTRTRRASLP